MTDEQATPITALVAKAWHNAAKRYLSIWGADKSGVCMVFDRKTELVAFRAEPQETSFGPDAMSANRRCEDFIDERCAEAALAVLRGAGLLR